MRHTAATLIAAAALPVLSCSAPTAIPAILMEPACHDTVASRGEVEADLGPAAAARDFIEGLQVDVTLLDEDEPAEYSFADTYPVFEADYVSGTARQGSCRLAWSSPARLLISGAATFELDGKVRFAGGEEYYFDGSADIDTPEDLAGEVCGCALKASLSHASGDLFMECVKPHTTCSDDTVLADDNELLIVEPLMSW